MQVVGERLQFTSPMKTREFEGITRYLEKLPAGNKQPKLYSFAGLSSARDVKPVTWCGGDLIARFLPELCPHSSDSFFGSHKDCSNVIDYFVTVTLICYGDFAELLMLRLRS